MYHVKGKYVTPPEQGRLSQCIDLVSRNMIFPEDRARFLEFFNLDALRQNFAAGREYLIGEFRKLWHDRKYHWASITMFPVAQPDGGDEILSRLHHGYRGQEAGGGSRSAEHPP